MTRPKCIPAGLAALVLAFTLALGACNTVEGVGQDISAVGNAVSDAFDSSSDAR